MLLGAETTFLDFLEKDFLGKIPISKHYNYCCCFGLQARSLQILMFRHPMLPAFGSTMRKTLNFARSAIVFDSISFLYDKCSCTVLAWFARGVSEC